jgi:Domain of unknown function (DUF4157)/Putative peptidoglycan binding domain
LPENSIISPQVQTAAAANVVMPSTEPVKTDLEKEPLQWLPIQRRLSVGAVDDPLEQEADAMADRVMCMPEPFTIAQAGGEAIQRKCAACDEEETVQRRPGQTFLQRQCARCDEEEKVQMKPLASSITPFIQAKGAGGGAASDTVTQQINATRGSGSSMDRPTQSFMESRFGTDFSNVKIHTGDDAVQMSRELNAQAFTVGSDIYFNSGKYNPSSDSGRHLLAHELTHTVQQGGGVTLQRKPDATDEEKKYADIDYKNAAQQNLDNWYVRDEFYNIFYNVAYRTGTGIFPGSTPIAYANHVYELQTMLKKLWKDKYLGQLNGIVDERLITDLGTIAAHYESKLKAADAAYGIDPIILERFLRIARNITRNKPLSSGLSLYPAFVLINENHLFGVSQGDIGDHVEFLTTQLFEMNYLKRDDVTRKYDQKTYEAVRQFQHDTGMNIDGIVGPDTLQMLDALFMGRTSAYILPGSRFMALGKLADTIIIYTDGDGDQKKELKMIFGKKGDKVTVVIQHVDTGEKRGPLSFSFPGLDLNAKMWIHEYERSNAIDPTVIKLENTDTKKADDGTPEPSHTITILPPDAALPGLYRFNDQTAQFNEDKFDPAFGFTSALDSDQANTTNPTYVVDVGPYADVIKLFFKSADGTGTLAPDAATGRVFAADLFVIGLDKNIIFGGAPMRVKLKSTDLVIKTTRHEQHVIAFDLDNDGVEDITLHYRLTQAQKEQRPDFNRYIELFFNGPALEKQAVYQFEKISGYYVGKDTKNEELFKQLVPALGNEKLDQQEIPETRQQDIAILNNLLSQIYIKALEENLIEGDTYLAWKKLDISLQYLRMFVAGKKDLNDDDRDKIAKTAGFANDYMEKIRRDTKGKESTGGYGMAVGPGAASSTSYKSNPYTGDSKSSTTSGFYTSTTETSIMLGAEILLQQWDKVNTSYSKLADGFNLWVADKLKDKHTDDPTLAAQTRGAYLFTKELQGIIDNGNAIHLTRVKAVYYSYEKYMKEKGIPDIELPLYYYYNTASRKWWIVDFINPSSPYWNHVEIGENETPGDTPPRALFETLNNKNHLPKGILLYSTADKRVTGQVEMTEPWEWKDVLAWFAAAVGVAALIGSMIFSGGAATPASIMILQAMFAASAIAGGVAAGIDLYEHYKNEDLTPTTAMLDIGNIAASIVGLSALSGGRIIMLASQASVKGTPWVGTWAKLALAADKAYVPLAGLNLGINGFNIALLSYDTISQLDAIDKSGADQASKDRAKVLLLAQLAFAGGMTILSLKGDIASLKMGTNIVIYPGKNGIPVAASAAEGIGALPVEELNLRAQDQFDQVLAIREKMFGKAASTEAAKLKGNSKFMSEYAKLNKEVYDILNDPAMDVATKKKMLAEKVDALDKLVGAQKMLDKTAFGSEEVRGMVDALEEGNFGMRMTLHNGTVKMQGVELGKFPELIERVKLTNESMKTKGSDNELVIILMPAVKGDGIQEILLLARKRWVIPSGAKPGVSIGDIGKANTAHKQYIIDVGGGTNSFAVDMIPAADLQGSTIINTEYAPTFMEPSMTRGTLTWKNAAAKTDANTVVVIGDPLMNMNEMTGDKSVRQVFINNVNAHFDEAQYKRLAEQLVKSMDNGGKLTVQWTDATEFDARLKKEVSRGHIDGPTLDTALQKAAADAGRTVTHTEGLAPFDYNYGITPSKDAAITPDRPLTDAERKGVTDPVPKFRWEFVFN